MTKSPLRARRSAPRSRRRPSAARALRRRRHLPVPDSSTRNGHTQAVSAGHSPRADQKAASRPPEQDRERAFRKLRHYVPAEILDVSFPIAVRGYERHAVDEHIKRVNRAIAELKVSASPPAAVRHALDVAGEKVEDLLEAAREAAEQLTEAAHREAEESTARIKAAAAELVVNASTEADRMRAEAESLIANAAKEAADTIAKAKAESAKILEESKAAADERLTRAHTEAAERLRHLDQQLAAVRDRAEARIRVIQSDTDAIRKQRNKLLDDIRATAARLGDLADAGVGEAPEPTTVAQETETLVDTLAHAAAASTETEKSSAPERAESSPKKPRRR
jgi:cell division septum initiation protein DivIVA